MASYSVDYNASWKWFYDSNWNLVNVYWEDFNFIASWSPDMSDWATLISGVSTSFDLTGFQPWHEVMVYACRVHREWPWQSLTQNYTVDFLRSSNWSSWSTWWYFNTSVHWDSIDETQYAWWTVWQYSWIDDDEIRPWYNYYKTHVYSSDWLVDVYSPTFTVSNLSIDSSLHPYWHLWVEWSRLCYIDWTGWELWNNGYWYKHRIAYDSWYSDYVWTDKSWSIWLEDWVARRIYYVDEYWYKRRTYEASNRYWYTSWQWYYSWTMYKWGIWCPWNYASASDWYWHLCFINPNWYRMRILNWPPQWYE